jgi:pilus assembly protein CpaB
MTRLFTGRHVAFVFLAAGLALAIGAFALVASIGQRAQAAALHGVPQTQVVMATQPIAQHMAIRAGAVALRPFPTAFVPAGAATRLEDVVGKYATADLARDQIVLTAQVSPTRRANNLSALIPDGQVAFWMPLPDLLAQSGGLRAGDRVDILLSLDVSRDTQNLDTRLRAAAGVPTSAKGLVTQTTLQNVEVFFTGSASNADLGEGQRPSGGARVVVFLLDPQDALLAKHVKDSGGTIDLVLRSASMRDRYDTEAISADTVLDRFQFRVPWNTPASTPDGRAPAAPAAPADGGAGGGNSG